jgi:hypothetical protein
MFGFSSETAVKYHFESALFFLADETDILEFVEVESAFDIQN